jgi:hypothetical protein
MPDPVIDPHETVTVERPDGRSLSGSGVSEESLEAVVEQRSPEPSPAEPAIPAEPEREPKGRQRYSKLTAEREAALTEARAAQALADELRTRLALLEGKELERQQARPVEQPPPAAAEYTRPKPAVAEIGTKYSDYESYVEDLADWKVEQREGKLRQEFDARFEQRIEAERASVRQRAASQSVLDRGRAAYPDFDAVVSGCSVQFPAGMLENIAKMPNAEHIEYLLGKDPQWAAEVAAQPDGLSLGLKLAERVPSGSRAVPASRPPVARTSQAPPPYEPVAGGSSTSAPPLADLADRGDFEAYKARRASELKSAGGVTAHR